MRVTVAGTFGPIHDGHRALFEAALERGDEGVVVGLTDDAFANSTRERDVPSFVDRVEAIRRELAAIDRWDRDVEIREVDDPYDWAATDPGIDAIVVSGETEDRVDGINRRREERGLDPLEAIVVPLVEAEDGSRISSTRIVEGAIDEHGKRSG